MKGLLKKYIEGKKVAILGFGREGKSTLKLCEKLAGYESITILDLNPVSCEYEDVKYITGEKYQEDLDAFDVVIKSPGIVLDKDFSSYKCEILSQTEIFFRAYKNQIIGITGTKGKSTTTALIHHILKEANKAVVLAGNIGIPAFDIIDQIGENTTIVFEMSSHMLEFMKTSPKIGVFLNIHEEHLDHYGTMEKYVLAKKNIYLNQGKEDFCFVNANIDKDIDSKTESNIIKIYGEFDGDVIPSEVKKGNASNYVAVSGNEVSTDLNGVGVVENAKKFTIPVEEIKIFGEHNYFDIGVAYGVLSMFGIEDEEFLAGLKTYEALPHRLQYVCEVDGVKYYDDSISTICDTAIQAMNCVPNISTILIGGMDRGIDYTELIEYLSTSPIENIVLMYETGKRILDEINKDYKDFGNKERITLVENLDEAVEVAKKVTKTGKACVMSPAAASYGYFKNFEERGEKFSELVKINKN